MRISQPGPPGQANVAPWRHWLLPTAIGVGFLALLVLPRGAPPAMPLTYTRFVSDQPIFCRIILFCRKA